MDQLHIEPQDMASVINDPFKNITVELGCSNPIKFMTSEGIKTMQPGKIYNEKLEEMSHG